jgi:hypothetical protein
MNPGEVYAKTDKGREEIQSRQYKLASAHRMLLIMIDGKTKAGDILKQTAQTGVTTETLDQLLAQGFIALQGSAPAASAAQPASEARDDAGPNRFSEARKFMNETAVNAGGLKSFMITLKLEKAESVQDLKNLFHDYRTLIEKGTGKSEAEIIIKRAKELVG